MNKFLIAAAIAATLGLPSIASAQGDASNSTIVCHPAATNETPNGTIQNTQYLCRPVNMDKIRNAMEAVMTDLNSAQKAKLNFAMQVLRDELRLEPQYPGFNGNQNN
jgi:hypothetical protein